MVSEAIKQATKAHWDEITQKEKEEADRLREKGQPSTPLELHQAADQRMEELRQLDIHHMELYNTSNKVIHDGLCELLGRANLYRFGNNSPTDILRNCSISVGLLMLLSMLTR